MSTDYGVKECKAILETSLKRTEDPMHIPFGMSPEEGKYYRMGLQAAYVHALEMLPVTEDK